MRERLPRSALEALRGAPAATRTGLLASFPLARGFTNQRAHDSVSLVLVYSYALDFAVCGVDQLNPL